MFVYLAHPIDQVKSGLSILHQMIVSTNDALTEQGISCFRPGYAYGLNPGSSVPDPAVLRTIDTINRQAIWESDGVVALLPPGVPTLGVPSEIEYALILNRPVVIITTAGLAENSVQIANWMSRGAQVRLIRDDGRTYAKWPNLVDALSSLPDPTKLVVGGTPDLLVSGVAANLKPGKYEGDAGLDLALAFDEKMQAGEYRMLSTGVRVAIPQGYFGWITGRSSTWAKHRCSVRDAIIDSGYRGELKVGLQNGKPTTDIVFEAGTRLAQLILLPVFDGRIEQVDELPEAHRGEAGYGSSGH